MAKKPTNFLTISEAAARLGVTRSAIHAAIKSKRLKAKKGKFQVERTIKRTLTGWRIDESDLDKYVVDATRQDAGKKIDLA